MKELADRFVYLQRTTRGRVRRSASVALLTVGVGLLTAVCRLGASSPSLPSAALSAPTIAVNDGDVAGLIAAIQTLNGGGGGTIQLSPNGNYSVTQPSDWWYGPNAFPAISSAIIIQGNGATIVRAAGAPKFRFFYVSGGFSTLPAGNLTLQNLTLTGGLARGGNGGAGLVGGAGGAGMGGAIYNQGNLTTTIVTFGGNVAQGASGGSGTGSGHDGGGGGIGGDGGNASAFANSGGGGGGFKTGGGGANNSSFASGGSFVGNEGGQGERGGISALGGNGGSSSHTNGGPAGGGGGGGFSIGQNGGDSYVAISNGQRFSNGGGGAIGGGNGGNFYQTGCGNCGAGGGGGGAFGGGGVGANDFVGGGGAGGVGGGGGGGYNGGDGGFGAGGAGGLPGGTGGFGGGGGGSYGVRPGFNGFGGGRGIATIPNGGGVGGNGGGGAGLGGAIFNHGGSVAVHSSAFNSNSATGGASGGTADGFGAAVFNLDGTVTLDTVTYSSNTASKSDGTPDVGAVIYNLSHNAGNTASAQTPLATLNLFNTTISAANGDLVNSQVDGTAIVIDLDNLNQTYTGSPLAPSLSTIPDGLNVTLTGAPQTNAGSYPVTATVTGPGYTSTTNAIFVIQPAQATVTLGNLNQTFTGAPLSPGVTTSPAGLNVTLSGAPQTNAGSYPVTARVNDPNYQGSSSGTFVIAPATATVTLTNLTQVYTGSALIPTATTSPTGLNIVWTGTPQTNAGSYAVTATVSDPNYQGSASGTFVISKTAATITLSNLTKTYNGSPQSPTATTVPAGLNVQITGAPKTNAGSYPVTATINDPNYQGSATGTLVINKAQGSVFFSASSLTQTFNGTPLSPTTATVPAGLSVQLTGVPQTNAGSYHVTAAITDPNYQGGSTGNFLIKKAAATVTLGSLTQTFNGNALSPTVSTTPTGLSVTLSGAPQTNAGSYPVTATVTDPNHTGSTSGTLVISPLNITGTITATALYYRNGTWSSTNPKPISCNGVTGPCQAYSDLMTFTVTIPAVVDGQNVLTPVPCTTATGTVTAPCINFASLSAITYGPVALNASGSNLTGTITTGVANTTPSGHAFGAITPVAASGGNPNFTISAPGQITTVVEDASLTYTGLTDFTTSGTASTQDISVSYTVRDPSTLVSSSPIYDPSGGNIQNAKLTFTLTGASPTGPFTGSCNPSSLSLVGSGTGTATAQCVIANVPVNGSYTLSASATSGSTYKPTAGDLSVAIANGNDGAGSIKGDGSQTAEYLAASEPAQGKYNAAGLITPAPGTKVKFNFEGKYKDKGKGIDAHATIEIQAMTQPVGPDGKPKPNKELHTYRIEAVEVQSLTIEPPLEKWVSTARITDTTDHNRVVATNAELQMVMDAVEHDVHGPGAPKPSLSIQISEDANGLWFSNNWTGLNTAVSQTVPQIQEGTIEFKEK